ncbi:Cys-rich peptide radical SAM maturase CcpM [Desulfovibrio inopinatus]|uniref:Cys-rich peptide radical SAM maturase CcpM n=1 Tax=Desulfovibrio inopinatus TaxID=102109 RepID=UPI00041547E2|nr:Cys-rich peptide radical SAM maturase CcpM [Desulfovibrio inopinatus]
MNSQLQCYVYPFSTPNSYYLYDATTNSVIKTTPGIYDYFKHDTPLSPEDTGKFKTILKLGYISGNPIKSVGHPVSSILPRFLQEKIQGITLQVTQQCNLRCHYCVYSGSYEGREHSSKRMSLETALAGVDFLHAHSTGMNMVGIGFYGGEPLLEFSLIKSVVNYAKKKNEGKNVHFHMTTNATLFNDEIFDFLQENEFTLLVSLDGPKEIHDKNRIFAATGGGTFDTIMANIAYMKENYPSLYKRMMVNAVVDQSLDATCSNEFFVQYEALDGTQMLSNPINPEYRKGVISSSDSFLIHDETESFKSLLYQIGLISEKSISHIAKQKFSTIKSRMFTLRERSVGLHEEMHHSGPCIAGARKLFLNVHGDLFPCERVNEESEACRIGNLSDGFDVDKVDALINIGKLTEDQCKKCWAIRMCTQCLVAADTEQGLSREKKKSDCKYVKINADNLLKDYVTLIEYGYRFEDDEPILTRQERI